MKETTTKNKKNSKKLSKKKIHPELLISLTSCFFF